MTEWFMCVFTRTLPWSSVLRVWDIFFFEGKAFFDSVPKKSKNHYSKARGVQRKSALQSALVKSSTAKNYLKVKSKSKVRFINHYTWNFLWDILRLLSSTRPMCHSHTMTNMGREPATIHIAAYRSSPCYALRHGRRVLFLALAPIGGKRLVSKCSNWVCAFAVYDQCAYIRI